MGVTLSYSSWPLLCALGIIYACTITTLIPHSLNPSWWCYWVTHLGGLCFSTITIDREIFMLKIICVKNFHVVKFSRFRWSVNFFLMVDDYNMDECPESLNERLESFYHLVYYQVSGEPGIAGCSCRSDIYPGKCGSFHWSSLCKFNFRALKFRSWSRPWNYFNSKIFPIYSMLFIMPADVPILSSLY